MSEIENEDVLYTDEDHPIPSVHNLDVFAVKKDGGATLAIVIATPIAADYKSQKRVLRKLENYLSFANSTEFEAECGRPSPSNTTILFSIKDGSDPIVFELIERCRPWALENNVAIEVQRT